MRRTAPRMATFLVVMTLAMLTAGCPRKPETRISLEELISRHNNRTDAIPRLWARVRMKVTMDGLSWGSTSPLAAPNGLLLLGKEEDPAGPHNFVLIGRESLALELFRAGTNVDQDVYYFWYNFGDYQSAYWGRLKLAGAPGVDIPVDPTQLLSALQVLSLPTDLTVIPAVAIRMTQEPPWAYVVTYIDRQPVSEQILFRREVYYTWSDTEPARPFRVILFDNTGEQVMTAEMSRYEPIATEWSEEGPLIPTQIKINWPAENTSLSMSLSEMTTEDRWDVLATEFSPPAAIDRRNIIQVDATVARTEDAE